jgi:hypothetical protein
MFTPHLLEMEIAIDPPHRRRMHLYRATIGHQNCGAKEFARVALMSERLKIIETRTGATSVTIPTRAKRRPKPFLFTNYAKTAA